MSTLYKKLEADVLAAMKQRDAGRLKILRFLKSNVDSEAKAKLKQLTDEEVVKVIQRRIKQSQDAKEQFARGGREELADEAQFEVALMRQYLPAQLSDVELRSLVSKIVHELQAVSLKDFGRVMGRAVKEVNGSADGQRVKAAVESALGK